MKHVKTVVQVDTKATSPRDAPCCACGGSTHVLTASRCPLGCDSYVCLFTQVRAGSEVSNAELVKFASLFNDELTLDNLDRVQLVSMCQLLSIPPFGTDSFLKNRLRSNLDKIKQVRMCGGVLGWGGVGGSSRGCMETQRLTSNRHMCG
jgi:hypothetical protein